MGEVNVYYVLVITHSILLCLVTSVDSTNNSNATGTLVVYPLNRNWVSCQSSVVRVSYLLVAKH